MNTNRMIDEFCKYYSCCYETHILRLEHGIKRFSVNEYISARNKVMQMKKDMKNQIRALSALETEARLEAEKHFGNKEEN